MAFNQRIEQMFCLHRTILNIFEHHKYYKHFHNIDLMCEALFFVHCSFMAFCSSIEESMLLFTWTKECARAKNGERGTRGCP